MTTDDFIQRPDARIAIAGTIVVAADQRDACIEASLPLQQSTLADEPGCLAYVFSAAPDNLSAIAVFELWTDAASLDAHFQHPNYHGMRNVFAAHGLRGATVNKYRIDAECAVYGDDRIATARFW